RFRHRGARGLSAGGAEPGQLRGALPGATRRRRAKRGAADHHAKHLALTMRALAAAVLAFCAGSAVAIEYRAIGERAAVLYDAPSSKADRLFVASRYYPFEVLVKLDQWTKVRDADGGVAWVENKALGEQPMV